MFYLSQRILPPRLLSSLRRTPLRLSSTTTSNNNNNNLTIPPKLPVETKKLLHSWRKEEEPIPLYVNHDLQKKYSRAFPIGGAAVVALAVIAGLSLDAKDYDEQTKKYTPSPLKQRLAIFGGFTLLSTFTLYGLFVYASKSVKGLFLIPKSGELRIQTLKIPLMKRSDTRVTNITRVWSHQTAFSPKENDGKTKDGVLLHDTTYEDSFMLPIRGGKFAPEFDLMFYRGDKELYISRER